MKVIACPSCGKKNRVPAASSGVPQCGHCKAKFPWLVDATDSNFDECGPCRVVAPILERVSKSYAGRLKIVKVNVDENPRLASRFQAQSIPTMLLLKEGKVAARQVGAMAQPQLEGWLAANGVAK